MGQKAKDAMRVIIQLGILFLTLAAPALPQTVVKLWSVQRLRISSEDAFCCTHGGESIRLEHNEASWQRGF